MSAAAIAVAGVAAGAVAGGVAASQAKNASGKAAKAQREATWMGIAEIGKQYNLNMDDIKQMYAAVEGLNNDLANGIKVQQTPYQTMGAAGTQNVARMMGVVDPTRLKPVEPTAYKAPVVERGGQIKEWNAPADIRKDAAEQAYAMASAEAAGLGLTVGQAIAKGYGGQLEQFAIRKGRELTAAADAKDAAAEIEGKAKYTKDLAKYKADTVAWEKQNVADTKAKGFGSVVENYKKTIPTYKPIPNYKPLPKYTPTTIADMKRDPGYQVRLDEGRKTLQNSQAAQGGLLSGNAIRGGIEYGQQFASNEFNAADNRHQRDWTTQNNQNVQTFGIQDTQNTNTYLNNLQDWATGYQKFESDKNDPFSKYMTLMGIGQQAENTVNTANSNRVNAMSNLIGNTTAARMGLRTQWGGDQNAALTGNAQTTADDILYRGAQSAQATKGYGAAVGQIASIAGGAAGSSGWASNLNKPKAGQTESGNNPFG